jgi:hypothetical protein
VTIIVRKGDYYSVTKKHKPRPNKNKKILILEYIKINISIYTEDSSSSNLYCNNINMSTCLGRFAGRAATRSSSISLNISSERATSHQVADTTTHIRIHICLAKTTCGRIRHCREHNACLRGSSFAGGPGQRSRSVERSLRSLNRNRPKSP